MTALPEPVLESIPPPAVIRDRLGRALREVEILRRLLTLAKRAEEYREIGNQGEGPSVPRKRTPAPDEPQPAAPVHTINPTAAYFLDEFRRAFRLRNSTVRREWKAGRLRLAKRAGRIVILGAWALEWLEGGEMKAPRPRLAPPDAGSA